MVGLSAPNPEQRAFREKSFGNQKAFNKIKWYVRVKFLRIFKGLFSKSLLKQGLERQFQHITKKQKTRCKPRFFMCVISWGYPPQTPTQETFREKFLGTSKAFEKIKWCLVRKFFGLPFLGGKVSFNKTVQS